MNIAALDTLTDAVRSVVSLDPARIRRLRDAGGGPDRVMWSRLARAGVLAAGLSTSERTDGAGTLVPVARHLGAAAAPEPFVAAGVLPAAILRRSGDAGSAALLSALLDGRTLMGVGWQTTLRARSSGDQTLLDGQSRFLGVWDADRYLLAAGSDAGIGIYLAEVVPGLTATAEHWADGTASADLRLEGVAARAIVEPPLGAEVLAEALDIARLACSAELLGVMDRALELTLDRQRRRKQFDRPIGAFQALQHRVVDMWMQRQLTEAALHSAEAVFRDPAAGRRRRATAASSVKARASFAGPAVCTGALQLHGAIGFSDECELGLYINRALALAPWLGNAAEHRRRHLQLLEGPCEA